VKFIKQEQAATPRLWSVAELGAFYTEHSFELKTHANRILKDSTRADEVVQDAFIKVMLAAPELASDEHALSYLHRTIENLCIDLFRAEGRRPNLVALDDASAEVESQWQDQGDHSQVITAAEDAAIIRQALALLSPAERTALVMWEMDGRSTAEIAAELGIKESSVRHTVSRARASLRTILSTLIIDEERGLTALDLLSTSYKKAAELAKKSSRAALSLFLVVGAFLGFHAFTGQESKIVASAPVQSSTQPSSQSPASAAVTAPAAPTTPLRSIAVQASSRSEQIQSLTEQLQFAQVELSAQVDLLNVINDTNVFGQNTQVAALTIQPLSAPASPQGGADTN
jgi:RNA polymerase sigma factor (sigma-70 family)